MRPPHYAGENVPVAGVAGVDSSFNEAPALRGGKRFGKRELQSNSKELQ